MKINLPIIALVILCLFISVAEAQSFAECSFYRGDANSDGKVDLTDPISILNYLFKGGVSPFCLDAADANDDGNLDLTDSIYLLNYLFLGGPSPSGITSKNLDYTSDELSCGKDYCNQCNGHLVTTGCFCGDKLVSSDYCCFGKEQATSCEYNVFSDSLSSEKTFKKKIFSCPITNPDKCNPYSFEYQLTDSAYNDVNPQIAHINYCNLGDKNCIYTFPTSNVMVWQRYEAGVSNIYSCPTDESQISKDCEKNKVLLDSGFNPSVGFYLNFGWSSERSKSIPKYPYTKDIVAVWETQDAVKGCILEYDYNLPKPHLSCDAQIISTEEINKFAQGGDSEPLLLDKGEDGPILLWKSGRENPNEPASDKLFICELTLNNLMQLDCSTPQVDLGNIGPETGDATYIKEGNYNTLAVIYSKKISADDSLMPEHKIYINKNEFDFSEIITLEKITLLQSPQFFKEKTTETLFNSYFIFKDINYINPLLGEVNEHIIWIVGGKPDEFFNLVGGFSTITSSRKIKLSEASKGGIKLFRVVSDYHLSTHGSNLVCNSDSCYIWDKQMGPKQDGQKSVDGKITEENNFQNDLLLCKLNGIGLLEVGGRTSCVRGGSIERVL